MPRRNGKVNISISHNNVHPGCIRQRVIRVAITKFPKMPGQALTRSRGNSLSQIGAVNGHANVVDVTRCDRFQSLAYVNIHAGTKDTLIFSRVRSTAAARLKSCKSARVSITRISRFYSIWMLCTPTICSDTPTRRSRAIKCHVRVGEFNLFRSTRTLGYVQFFSSNSKTLSIKCVTYNTSELIRREIACKKSRRVIENVYVSEM